MNDDSENENSYDREFFEIDNRSSLKRMQSNASGRKKARRIISVFIALILCVLLALLCVVMFFGLKNIKVNGLNRYTEKEITEACELDGALNLFGIDLDGTAQKLKDKFPYISSVKLERKLPSTLVIDVKEDVPAYCAEIYGDRFIISKEMRVISRHAAEEEISDVDDGMLKIKLPPVRCAIAGDYIEFDLKANRTFMSEFLNELTGNRSIEDIEYVDASDRYHIAVYASNGRYKILVGDASELETKLALAGRVIDSSLAGQTSATLNAEKTNSVVVLRQNERFTYK